jgi:hypothetical protein
MQEKLTVGELRKIIRDKASDCVVVFERYDRDGNLFDARYMRSAYGAHRYGEDSVVFQLGKFARVPGGREPGDNEVYVHAHRPGLYGGTDVGREADKAGSEDSEASAIRDKLALAKIRRKIRRAS